MVLEQLGIHFAGKWRFFCFGRRCSLDGGFLVIWADFWIKRQIARDRILCDETALKRSCGANEDEPLYMY